MRVKTGVMVCCLTGFTWWAVRAEDVTAVFFQDAFAEGLQGTPLPEGQAEPPAVAPVPSAAPGRFGWSEAISAEVLEDEIKRTVLSWHRAESSGRTLATETRRRYAGHLALLFAVVSEFDGEIRWREAARSISVELAPWAARDPDRPAAEGLSMAVRLDGLVRGARWEPAIASAGEPWRGAAQRDILMRRVETALKRCREVADSALPFRPHVNRLQHELMVVRMAGVALSRPEWDDSGDEEYQRLCQQLQDTATESLQALPSANAEPLLDSLRGIERVCDACHQTFRG